MPISIRQSKPSWRHRTTSPSHSHFTLHYSQTERSNISNYCISASILQGKLLHCRLWRWQRSSYSNRHQEIRANSALICHWDLGNNSILGVWFFHYLLYAVCRFISWNIYNIFHIVFPLFRQPNSQRKTTIPSSASRSKRYISSVHMVNGQDNKVNR